MCFRCVVNAGEVPVEGGEVGNEGSKGREFLVFDFILPTERNPYVHLWNPHSKQSNAKQGKTTCDLGALSFPNGPLLMGAGKSCIGRVHITASSSHGCPVGIVASCPKVNATQEVLDLCLSVLLERDVLAHLAGSFWISELGCAK